MMRIYMGWPLVSGPEACLPWGGLIFKEAGLVIHRADTLHLHSMMVQHLLDGEAFLSLLEEMR